MRIPIFIVILVSIMPLCRAAEPKSSQGESAPAAADIKPEAKLKQGMKATQVKKIMGGDPNEISPFEVPEGKAEIWIYRRTRSTSVEPILMGYKPATTTVQDANGNLREVVVAQEPIYKDQRTITADVIQLLMFNGCYVNQKRTVQKRKEMM